MIAGREILTELLDVSFPLWLVLAVAMIGTGVLFRRALKRAKLEARLARSRGRQR